MKIKMQGFIHIGDRHELRMNRTYDESNHLEEKTDTHNNTTGSSASPGLLPESKKADKHGNGIAYKR